MAMNPFPGEPGVRHRPLICLPTYNERDNVSGLVARIQALPLAADILFIDDNSPDGTGAVLDGLAQQVDSRMARQERAIHVIHRPSRQGVGSAHLEAIRFGYRRGHHLLITMDADGTHAPEDIPRLVESAGAAGVVVGSRFLPLASDRRNRRQRLQSRLVHGLTSRLLKLPNDMSNAFRLYRLDKIDASIFSQCRSNSYAFFPESLYLLHQQGIIIRDIPVGLSGRWAGESKMRWRDVGEWMVRLVALRAGSR